MMGQAISSPISTDENMFQVMGHQIAYFLTAQHLRSAVSFLMKDLKDFFLVNLQVDGPWRHYGAAVKSLFRRVLRIKSQFATGILIICLAMTQKNDTIFAGHKLVAGHVS